MTKNWAAEEVREAIKGFAGCSYTHHGVGGDLMNIASAYAERIEADKSAVPVAWMCETINGYKAFSTEGPSFPCNVGAISALFAHPSAQVARPCREAAERSVADFLKEKLGSVPTFELAEDGENHWSFWVTEDGCEDDTTSYVHADLSIEWYGTAWEAPTAEPVARQWQTIHAHLMSQEASITNLRIAAQKVVLANADLRVRAELAESRLAAANALFREMYQDMGRVIFSGNVHVDRWMVKIDEHLQGAGDE